jgi:hypothetical protein
MRFCGTNWVAFSLLFVKTLQNLIKTLRLRALKLLWINKRFVACWHSGNLIFYYCIHFSDSEVNSSCKHVLIVDKQPTSQNIDDFRKKNFIHLQLTELLLLQDWVSFSGLWFLSKVLTVGSLVHQLSEVLFHVCFLPSVS